MDQSANLILISDLLSKEELQSALTDVDVTLISLNSEDKLRGLADPEVLAAIITGAVSLISPVITVIVTKLVERYKDKKKDGLIIIKNEIMEIHIPFEATEEEMNEKLEMVKKLSTVEHLMITHQKDA